MKTAKKALELVVWTNVALLFVSLGSWGWVTGRLLARFYGIPASPPSLESWGW